MKRCSGRRGQGATIASGLLRRAATFLAILFVLQPALFPAHYHLSAPSQAVGSSSSGDFGGIEDAAFAAPSDPTDSHGACIACTARAGTCFSALPEETRLCAVPRHAGSGTGIGLRDTFELRRDYAWRSRAPPAA